MYLQVYSELCPTTARLFPQAFPGVFVADLSAFATPIGHVATITARPELCVIVVDLFLKPFAVGFVLTILVIGLLRLSGVALLGCGLSLGSGSQAYNSVCVISAESFISAAGSIPEAFTAVCTVFPVFVVPKPAGVQRCLDSMAIWFVICCFWRWLWLHRLGFFRWRCDLYRRHTPYPGIAPFFDLGLMVGRNQWRYVIAKVAHESLALV